MNSVYGSEWRKWDFVSAGVISTYTLHIQF